MYAYEILPHTADSAIRAYGTTREELFINALAGMAAVSEPELCQPLQTITRTITVQADTPAHLLVAFLSEALYLSDVHNEVYQSAHIARLTDTALEATLVGAAIERLGLEIKAVTYHTCTITQQNNLWQATVIFDI